MRATSLRGDGRRGDEVRRLSCALGVAEACDGSALLSQGLTKVMAAVHGPREAGGNRGLHDRALVRCEVTQAAFSTFERRRRRAGDKRAAAVASFVEETFSHVVQAKLFSKSQIDITVHIFQADGGLLAACINAVSLALTHAGIPMVDFVSSCSIGYLDGALVQDLNHQEESAGGPQLCLTLMPRSSRVLTLKMESSSTRVSTELLQQMVEEAQIGCHKVGKALQSKVHEFVDGALQRRGDTAQESTA